MEAYAQGKMLAPHDLRLSHGFCCATGLGSPSKAYLQPSKHLTLSKQAATLQSPLLPRGTLTRLSQYYRSCTWAANETLAAALGRG